MAINLSDLKEKIELSLFEAVSQEFPSAVLFIHIEDGSLDWATSIEYKSQIDMWKSEPDNPILYTRFFSIYKATFDGSTWGVAYDCFKIPGDADESTFNRVHFIGVLTGTSLHGYGLPYAHHKKITNAEELSQWQQRAQLKCSKEGCEQNGVAWRCECGNWCTRKHANCSHTLHLDTTNYPSS